MSTSSYLFFKHSTDKVSWKASEGVWILWAALCFAGFSSGWLKKFMMSGFWFGCSCVLYVLHLAEIIRTQDGYLLNNPYVNTQHKNMRNQHAQLSVCPHKGSKIVESQLQIFSLCPQSFASGKAAVGHWQPKQFFFTSTLFLVVGQIGAWDTADQRSLKLYL